jgi:hypothetical protein
MAASCDEKRQKQNHRSQVQGWFYRMMNDHEYKRLPNSTGSAITMIYDCDPLVVSGSERQGGFMLTDFVLVLVESYGDIFFPQGR